MMTSPSGTKLPHRSWAERVGEGRGGGRGVMRRGGEVTEMGIVSIQLTTNNPLKSPSGPIMES